MFVLHDLAQHCGRGSPLRERSSRPLMRWPPAPASSRILPPFGTESRACSPETERSSSTRMGASLSYLGNLLTAELGTNGWLRKPPPPPFFTRTPTSLASSAPVSSHVPIV